MQRRAPGEGSSPRSSDSGPRAFVSSTYADLAKHREYVIRALREAGISVDPMEDWTSSADEPRHFSTARIVGCDLCVLLIGFRRGHIPDGDTRSITQLEYEQARRLGIDVLAFMLDEDAAWPRRYDELDSDPGMRPWRAELTEAHGVTFFAGDPQTLRIEAALTRWMRERYLMRSPARAVGTAPPLPSLFVGRDDEVAALRDLVTRPHDMRAATGPAYPLIVVRGWPGVGKTTLAAHLAHDETLRQHFRDGVLWASLGPDPLLLEQLRSWARALGQNGQASSVEVMSQELAGALVSMSVLLIVDDLWDVAHIRPLRVGGRRSAMLVTTRLNDIADQLAPTPANIYNLAVLSADKGVELLRQLVPDVVSRDEHAVRSLVEDLEGLPLALQVAGSLLRSEAALRRPEGVSLLLDQLRSGAGLIDAPAPPDRAQDDVVPTVQALLSLSVATLPEEFQERFAYCGVFPPKPATFDAEALAEIWKVEDPYPTIRAFIGRGLLEPTDGGRFWMHAILVAFARRTLTD